MTTIIGIDPGLVDTGVVNFTFDTAAKCLTVTGFAISNTVSLDSISGEDAEEFLAEGMFQLVADVREYILQFPLKDRHIFIEEYRPRGGLKTNVKMMELQGMLRAAVPKSKFISNMGVLKLVKKNLLQLLVAHDFEQSTRHQDIRSAARIGLFGMMKDKELNALLYEVVHSLLNGGGWSVTHRHLS